MKLPSKELVTRKLADEAKSKEQSRKKQGTSARILLRSKIEELLEAGVSRRWIAVYLDCPVKTVDGVTKAWKRLKLPKILQKRARFSASSGLHGNSQCC